MSETLTGTAPLQYDAAEVAARLAHVNPSEGAVVLEFLPVEVAADATSRLDPQLAGKILSQMESARTAKLMAKLPAATATTLLDQMAPDDRVDCLAKLPRELHDELVGHLNSAAANETKQLEQYPPDSAGGIMTTVVTALQRKATVEEAVRELRRLKQELGQLFYVYVVDEQQRLVGVLSMRDLILAPPESTLEQIMIPGVRSVPATMDQEEVAQQMRESRYLALPVVDENRRLVGLITFDDVVDVIQEEATEDVQRMFGAGAEERLASSWQFSFSKRVWWLQVNLATAFLAGAVVDLFGGTISKFAVLAVFLPIVSGMGSNASAQAMSVAIRGIAFGKPTQSLLRHVLIRETIVGLLTGIIAGTITGLIAMLWQIEHGWALGFVVGISLIFTQTLACVSGAAIPFVMKKLNFDPAQSATIFATTITDVAGFASLLGLAKLCAGWLK